MAIEMREDIRQLIVTRLGNERYAIPISEILEIIRPQPMTGIPGGRTGLQGVINLRGSVVPVVCLRICFGLPSGAVSASARIIVVKLNGEPVGILVDAVEKVVSMDRLEPPVDGSGPSAYACVVGIAELADGLVGVLDLNKLLQNGTSNAYIL